MAAEKLLDAFLKMQDAASVKRVFGEPTVSGDKTIIPVATVSYMFGFGYGIGPEQEKDGQPQVTTGEGLGGGGMGQARPVAVLEVTPEGTQVKSIADGTRIALAGIALGHGTFFGSRSPFVNF